MELSLYVRTQCVEYEGEYHVGVFSTLDAAMGTSKPDEWVDEPIYPGNFDGLVPVQEWKRDRYSSERHTDYIFKYTLNDKVK